MGLCPTPHSGDFLRRSPLRTFKTFNQFIFLILSLHGSNSGVAVCRATNSGCSEQNPVERDFGAWRSLRYRIEMVQVSEWAAGGVICGALPADCAPEKSVTHSK